ncbi:hypothetical protein D3C87_2211940 [compost metagenome]
MKVKIKNELPKEGMIWWYGKHRGETFEVERDKDHPRTYFRLERNGMNHQIRCCDALIVK